MKNFLFMVALVMLCTTIILAVGSITFPELGKVAFIAYLVVTVSSILYVVYRYIDDKFKSIDQQIEEYLALPDKKHHNSCFANQEWYATRD